MRLPVLYRGIVRARPGAGADPPECRVDTDPLSSEQKTPHARRPLGAIREGRYLCKTSFDLRKSCVADDAGDADLGPDMSGAKSTEDPNVGGLLASTKLHNNN